MAFFTRKKIKIIGLVAIGALLALALFYLFSKGAKEKREFVGSESILETQSKTSPVQRLFVEPEEISGDLSITGQPNGTTVEIIKIISNDPLIFDQNTRQTLTAPFLLKDLVAGEYWVQAKQHNYYDFVGTLTIKNGQTNRLDIVLSPVLEAEKDVNTEGAPQDEIIAMTEKTAQYYRDNPLMSYLPYKTENFEIHVADQNDVYLIELFPDASKVQEYSQYLYELSLYKKEARDWIKSQGIDPDSVKIKWSPE